MSLLTNETKEQLLARLDQIHSAIAGTCGLTPSDNKSLKVALELASGETEEEFLVRLYIIKI